MLEDLMGLVLIYLPPPISPPLSTSLSVEFWFNNNAANCGVAVRNGEFSIQYCGPIYAYVNVNGAWIAASGSMPFQQWFQIAETWDGSNVKIYINGILQGSAAASGSLTWGDGSEQRLWIGHWSGGGWYVNGSIANIQIYNTSLSANEIQALYLEGIGGAPIRLQNLVAWYPLDGNANDYSGNGNNGQAYNVNFVSNWYSGYTPP